MIYCYKCDNCGAKKEVMKLAAKCRETVFCACRVVPMRRDFVAEHATQRMVAGNWPQHSDAAGVGASQVKEATLHSYEIGVPTHFTEDGQAIFNSPSHRKKYCEKIGLYDRNAGYSDPKPKNR